MSIPSIRLVMMDMLKKKFYGFSFWNTIEKDIALMCADLIEPITEEDKHRFVKQLYKMRRFLLSKGIQESDLDIIDDEIEIHKETKSISLYIEDEDLLAENIIEKYARLGEGTEGVVGIHQPLNYSQLSKLTNGVYNKTGLIKFYISKEKVLYGKIVAEVYEHPQKIPVAALIESKKINDATGEPEEKRVVLFGDKIWKHSYNIIKEISLPFYIYRFIEEAMNEEYILVAHERQEIGDCIITGVVKQCEDNKILTDSTKLLTKLPFLFVHSIRNRLIRFKSHEELGERIKFLGINIPSFFDFPFSINKGRYTWKMLHPEWYKWLLWAWLTHEPKGMMNNYPLHLLIIGPKHSGKSLLLNALHTRSKETRSVFSGSSSTMKHLVPSFKYNPARLGYLAESNRSAFCDEFLRCMVNTKTTKEGSMREESVAIMNDLLEHQKREAGSGVSSVHVNMTSRVIAMTNPVRDIHAVEDLIRNFDESFLSRWLIYYQTDDHVKSIRESDDSLLEKYNLILSTNDWISILDYLHTFSAEYDGKRVRKIHQSIPRILSENIKKHYDARHNHHINCLMDGIIKTRCLIECDMSFKAKEEDYERLKDIWLTVIKSWIKPQHLRNMDVSERIFYLPENCQFLYWKIDKLLRPVTKKEALAIAREAMELPEYNEAIGILIDLGVLIETEYELRPHYMKDES